jgi:hypothetical protein
MRTLRSTNSQSEFGRCRAAAAPRRGEARSPAPNQFLPLRQIVSVPNCFKGNSPRDARRNPPMTRLLRWESAEPPSTTPGHFRVRAGRRYGVGFARGREGPRVWLDTTTGCAAEADGSNVRDGTCSSRRARFRPGRQPGDLWRMTPVVRSAHLPWRSTGTRAGTILAD